MRAKFGRDPTAGSKKVTKVYNRISELGIFVFYLQENTKTKVFTVSEYGKYLDSINILYWMFVSASEQVFNPDVWRVINAL